jgi:2-dehydro-3-deoxyphosphogluconate aldolase/(4S)-4-hydroxy-2-oxoglutarate aldolase
MMKHQIMAGLLDPGVVAIIRADSSDQLADACEALVAGGVTAVEVTMTTPNALGVIREVTGRMGRRILMGVGTVLDDITARLAIEAGAEYVVTPVLRPDVISLCRRYSKPVLCGCYTPTEALAAHEAGADFIKLFPADGLGPKYIAAIKAPLPQLEIVPTGGVTVDTCADFIRAGCVAVAAGSSLVSKEILKNRDWARLTVTASQFVKNVAAARKG